MDPAARLAATALTPRGWGVAASGVLFLLLAQVMGRRDLLSLGLFLIVLPLLALAGLRLLKPRFSVLREFVPPGVQTGEQAVVHLTVSGPAGPGGRVLLEDRLPARFGPGAVFGYPSRSSGRGGPSRYSYRLTSDRRGLFPIGPVTAEFTDPFGLCRHRHALAGTDTLTVTPAAVELPANALTGARSSDGTSPTRLRATPSDDDVMTREYRHGDPMRRVHWAATARQGNLMVRQEESVTTPEAVLILDQRFHAYSSGFAAAFGAGGQDGENHPPQLTSERFEWAVTAAVSVATHLLDRGYTLRLLDTHALPGLSRSVSASAPDAEEFDGPAGLQAIREGLAALELRDPPHPRHGTGAGPETGRGTAFDEELLNKLAVHRHRGPLLAILGQLSDADARLLAAAADTGANAFALVVSEHGTEAQSAVDVLRHAGWKAAAVSPRTPLRAAWSSLDAPLPPPPPRRGRR
ncbi:DUF58 domain-containing protein [Paenarthrobacter sp. DKR-5]|uniref:DUF58 domain-containing protein n=1 Tax=Paenarthrobacter sp. DKR-5 TaxID=2835535 RepID=UPI0027DAF657|nr:DUF58 domain-containing protein [Paenarthrobacter sp. DKR-5]